MEITDIQKLGVGLASFGVFFLLLGVTLLFDKGLLAIGNLFCIAGSLATNVFHLTLINFLFQDLSASLESKDRLFSLLKLRD